MSAFCTRCKQGKAVVEKGVEMLCQQCAEKELTMISTAVMGGQMLSASAKQPANIIHANFDPDDKSAKTTYVESVDIIFNDNEGNKRLVRTVHSEQMAIAEKIIENRKFGKREFQYGDVAVIPAKMAFEMSQLIECLARENTAADFMILSQRAQKLLAEVKET